MTMTMTMTMTTLKRWALLAGILAVGSVYWLGCDCGGEKDNPVTGTTTPGNKPETWTPVPGTFTDIRDGTVYKKVKLNKATWMAENLKYKPDSGVSVCFGNNVENCATYGRLYDWTTAMAIASIYLDSTWGGSDVGHQGICPAGWHLPSRSEWESLFTTVDGISTAGKKLKSKDGWYDNGNGTDDYGFTALPGGIGNSDGSFDFLYEAAVWWTATEDKDRRYAWGINMWNYENKAKIYQHTKWADKSSIRCVEN